MLSAMNMETMAFLGASRGLGAAVVKEFDQQLEIKPLIVSRNEANLKALSAELKSSGEIYPCDFSIADLDLGLLEKLGHNERIFYFAGGGPFGSFQTKSWKDHQWALQVTFLTPAKILHYFLNNPGSVKQFVAIGSAIADSSADPMASSYASAKHGLKGLIDSVNAEKPPLDVRLFRPGYIDTDMLPPQARPRIEGLPILSPEAAAQEFVRWVQNTKGPKSLTLEAPR